ncbi:hypothetical protein E2320_000799 [Naja naja]|nr:hypothetical protein E2320_000799 [Naja naja]
MAKRTDYGLQVDYVFRGTEHVVRMTTEGNLLEVEVEDRLTTDQWRGEFDAAFIEDLTHKTGNFKQFGIFCSMLESALAQVRHESTSSIRTSRFDPTAFVKAKERKQKEIEQKNKRNLHRAMGDTPPSGWYHHTQLRGSSVLPGGSSLGKPRGRSSSVESFRSKRTSASSGSEDGGLFRTCCTKGPRADNAHKKRLSSTPNTGKARGKENLYDEPSADLSEIDARLQALQEYMNKLETQT